MQDFLWKWGTIFSCEGDQTLAQYPGVWWSLHCWRYLKAIWAWSWAASSRCPWLPQVPCSLISTVKLWFCLLPSGQSSREPIAMDDRNGGTDCPFVPQGSCSSSVAFQQPAAGVTALAGKLLMATDMAGISRAARVTCARPGSDTGRTLRNVPLGPCVLVQPVIFCSFLIFVTWRSKHGKSCFKAQPVVKDQECQGCVAVVVWRAVNSLEESMQG